LRHGGGTGYMNRLSKFYRHLVKFTENIIHHTVEASKGAHQL